MMETSAPVEDILPQEAAPGQGRRLRLHVAGDATVQGQQFPKIPGTNFVQNISSISMDGKISVRQNNATV